jgi:hypothetical protein
MADLSAPWRKYGRIFKQARPLWYGAGFTPARNAIDWRNRAGINPAPYRPLCVPEYVTVFGKRTT